MVTRALFWSLGALGCGFAALLGARSISTSAPPPAPHTPGCTITGAKHLSPTHNEAEACRRFMAGIAAAPGISGVELRVLPQGVLSAVVTRAGTAGPPRDFGLAVSDRPLRAEDLDQLAASVLAGLGVAVPK